MASVRDLCSSSGSTMPALVFEIEDGSQVVAPLVELTRVGSADGNDVIADRPDIAPRHAEIFPTDDGSWWVRDLGSHGGTFISGERITSRRLAPGDVLTFGSISARFTLVDGETPVDPGLALAAGKVEMLTQRLSYLGQQERSKLADLERLQHEVSELDAKKAEAERAAADFPEAIREKQEKLEQARKELGSASAELADIRKNVETAVAREAEARTTAAKVARQNEEAAAALQKAQTEHETTTAGIGRLAIELKALQEQITQQKANEKSAQEAAARRDEAEQAFAHATIHLDSTRTEHITAVEHLEQLRAEVGTLEESRDILSAENQLLQSSATDLATRVEELNNAKAEAGKAAADAEKLSFDASAKKDEADRVLQKVTAELESTRQKLVKDIAHSEKLRADIATAESHHTGVRAESEQFASLAQQGRDEVAALDATSRDLTAQNASLQAHADELARRISELGGTEENLLQAQAELKQAESERAALIIAMNELRTHHDATHVELQSLTTKVEDCRGYHAWYDIELPKLKEQHETAQKNLAEFEKVSAQTCTALTGRIESLKSSNATAQAAFDSLRSQTENAQRTLDGLNQRNADLKTATQNLEEVQSQLRDATAQKSKLDARLAELERSGTDARARLDDLDRTEKAANTGITKLRTQESDLQKTLKSLNDDQQRERSRFEELRSLAHDAAREGECQKQELGNNIAALHAEIARLESRLAHARTWNVEIDQLYEALGTMPDGSPEAREHWLEIQRRKKAIAEQLPTGIQVRAAGRTQVVPRGR